LKRAALVAAIALYAAFVIRTSWVSDDAFITLRVVDNAVHGFGPRWNVDERVQAFTHPLWFLVLTAAYAVTREPYLTTTVLCWLASLLTVGLLARSFARRDAAIGAALAVALALSRAYVDYSTSGLENPLTHLLLAVFALVVLDPEPWDERRLLHASLLAGLLTLNRMDALLFVAPAVGWGLLRLRHRRAIGAVALGAAPFVVWEAFATIYYGSPWPNTALAKLSTGIPAGELIAQGGRYLADALLHDPLTPGLAVAGIAAAAWRRRPSELALAAGALLSLLYVVKVGGDFMAGRFLAAPALVGAILLASAALDFGRRARFAALAAIAIVGAVGVAPTLAGGREYASRAMELLRPHGIADERRFYFASAGLFNGATGWTRPTPSNRSVNKGADLRRTGTTLTAEGAIGYVGYFAGPSVHIVDYHALADPLLARLPMVASDPFYAAFLRRVRPGEVAAPWRVGHFMRALPAGYLSSLASGENRIADPAVRALWDRVARVTRGPVWSAARLHDVVALLLSSGGVPRARPPFTPIPWGEITAVDPRNGEAVFQAALDAFEAGQGDRGAALLESTLAVAPAHERAMVRLAEIALDRGDPTRASDLVETARKLSPHDPAALGVAGDVARARGEDERATGFYLETARLDPAVAGRMYGNIGILHAMHADWSAALDWFGKAERLSPGDPLTAYNTGTAYARMGRREDARAAFERALRTDPRYEPARRALAMLK
jgi:arabinofuranosyltransferase